MQVSTRHCGNKLSLVLSEQLISHTKCNADPKFLPKPLLNSSKSPCKQNSVTLCCGWFGDNLCDFSLGLNSSKLFFFRCQLTIEIEMRCFPKPIYSYTTVYCWDMSNYCELNFSPLCFPFNFPFEFLALSILKCANLFPFVISRSTCGNRILIWSEELWDFFFWTSPHSLLTQKKMFRTALRDMWHCISKAWYN